MGATSAPEARGEEEEEDDDDDLDKETRPRRDFDLESFAPQPPLYDRYDPINNTRIIYFGETAEELEHQEKEAWTYKEKSRGWLHIKNQKILDRMEYHRNMDALAEELVFDSEWGLVDEIEWDAFQTGVDVEVGETHDILRAPNRKDLTYLEGYEDFQPHYRMDSTAAADDVMRTPGLHMQEMPEAPRECDVVEAHMSSMQLLDVKLDDVMEDRVSLSEGQITEDMIQRLLPKATEQGVSEEAVRMFARVLSDNAFLPIASKMRRLRILAGCENGDAASWRALVDTALTIPES